ncbi:MAG: hypothetical protein ABJA98_22365 [Acidobacteriota bacterium]
MKSKRIVAFVLVAAALAAWLAAAPTLGNRGRVAPPVVSSARLDTRGAALAAEIARLHENLRPSAVPRQPGRNLFSFTPRPVPAPPTPPAPRPALSEPVVPRPIPPVVKLSGIAEDVTAAGVSRTAIISGFGQLFLVKEGDSVTDRYRVAKISSDVVELSDLTGGAVLRLALK